MTTPLNDREVPERIASVIDRLAMAYIKMTRQASAVIVGDIFTSSWGWEQTNVDFYQVVKTTPKMVMIRKIDSKTHRQTGDMSRSVMPVVNTMKGPVLRKKLDAYQGTPMLKINTYSRAYKWDGKPQNETSYG
jgi:hypothetical protein